MLRSGPDRVSAERLDELAWRKGGLLPGGWTLFLLQNPAKSETGR